MPLTCRRRSLSEFGHDIRWGLSRTAPFVLVFGGMSLVGELLGVKFPGFDIERTIFFYLVFGLLTGLLVGALRPIASTLWGAGVIGALVGLPIGIFIAALAGDLGRWDAVDTVLVLILDFISAACAVGFRRGYMHAEARSRGESGAS